MPPRRRNNIVVVKLATSKRVKLKNFRTFYAKYKRTTKTSFPDNTTIKGRYKNRGQLRIKN